MKNKNILDKYKKEDLIENIESTNIDIENENENDIDITNDNEQRKLYVDKVDKSTSDLFRMLIEGELNLQPEYQRNFVREKKTMSKFIESLLLSIPIPTIFLAENEDDTFEVIDGQQRLTTIFSFMKSKLEKEQLEELPENLKKIEILSLTGLETLKQYNKESYSSMPDIKRKFNNVSLPIVIVKKDSSEDIKYDIFSRINSGSIKLNAQELLNVMYRGELLKTLNKLSTSKEVDDIFGNRPVLKKKFGYQEVLLRAIAMECFINKDTWQLQEVPIKNTAILNKEYKKYNGRLNSAILDYLKEFRNDSSEAKRLKTFLEDTINKVSIVFGEEAFKRINNKSNSTSINKTIAELQLVTLSRFDLNLIKKNKKLIKESFNRFLINNDENIFIRATNNTSNVEKRYKWGIILSNELKEM